MKIPQLKYTEDLNDLKLISGNRLISRDHVNVIKKSIKKKNLLPYAPLIINQRMEIVDGQHRYLAAKELGLPVYYLEAEDLDFSDIILLNSTLKSWSLTDYLETYIYQGKEDYKTLRKFAKVNNLSISNALAILSIGLFPRLNAPIQDFKKGEWEISDLKEAETFVRNFNDIRIYTEENTWKDRDFLKAIYMMFYKFEIHPSDFMDQLKKYPNPLFRRLNVGDYLRQFEDVYNYARKVGKARFV